MNFVVGGKEEGGDHEWIDVVEGYVSEEWKKGSHLGFGDEEECCEGDVVVVVVVVGGEDEHSSNRVANQLDDCCYYYYQ